ncbi:membrane-bound alkaline phosphatase-like [Malaya genurostris]|uniref:membrane-bound alkaline phosphatase-like n=1 Tax=Malaya genurostris TaxID=325434 RepID=UPI0026F3E57C|nr:membrane-bound alkaline phosphatase-like [Malaya genurostris]
MYLPVISVCFVLSIIVSCALGLRTQAFLDYVAGIDDEIHPPPVSSVKGEKARQKRVITASDYENTAQFWKVGAQLRLKEQLLKRTNRNVAKNVIFFLGDGMSITTLAASRMYLGQMEGQPGEESRLSFEEFPDVGLIKTYCVDRQVADSACSATAYLCGVKANYATIGVTAAVNYNNCAGSNNPLNHVDSIMSWAQAAGKATGIVTTTRVTHASPAGTYAHVANRDWECDADVSSKQENPSQCQDIAAQLVRSDPGRNFKVILGGGRRKFIPNSEKDPTGKSGQRKDGVNLISEWYYSKPLGSARYVTNRQELVGVNFNETEYLMGLFQPDHLKYNMDSNHQEDPSLSDMTYAAIKTLEKHSNGYVLFVEGGKIDLAHHETKARKSLDETIQFSDAVLLATQLTNPIDTLIVVTADHSHTMTLAGYSKRGHDILGVSTSAKHKKTYTTLSYANGPGGPSLDENGDVQKFSDDMVTDKEFQYPKLVPMKYETHGGDDVALFAYGPWSHLFSGMYEQNVIPHLIGYAACIGDGLTACKG